jgi:hypothetical protein
MMESRSAIPDGSYEPSISEDAWHEIPDESEFGGISEFPES